MILAAGEGFAMTMAGKVNAATTAAGSILERRMVVLGSVQVEC
jgi:hypothetical protein